MLHVSNLKMQIFGTRNVQATSSHFLWCELKTRSCLAWNRPARRERRRKLMQWPLANRAPKFLMMILSEIRQTTLRARQLHVFVSSGHFAFTRKSRALAVGSVKSWKWVMVSEKASAAPFTNRLQPAYMHDTCTTWTPYPATRNQATAWSCWQIVIRQKHGTTTKSRPARTIHGVEAKIWCRNMYVFNGCAFNLVFFHFFCICLIWYFNEQVSY